MEIITENLGKKFRNEWIFKSVNLRFQQGQAYTFTGSNGSGKSTFLQILSGFIPASEGKIFASKNQQALEFENIYKEISIAAPYLELIEEFTLEELLQFHIRFKPLIQQYSIKDFIEFIELPKASQKAIKHFSSGMKQRVKLGLTFWSDTPILMLDEPSSNLDAKATNWYLENVQKYSHNRMLFICSNQPNEYEFCSNIFNIQDYK
ncbi:ABC transporter ATP-binding protein [Flectobacillus longus]|uniref:ABC transporter ATP-binding protein n=1 Tax=Flectobacillus longus TaxID=2984207 RepID=UPI0024B66F1E|nr:ATP-binding cassette domain-containing protein [Flectobacillus longus]MDI9880867.1 ATP-binding cassette domain-containing protein [Flectobacillus longus]